MPAEGSMRLLESESWSLRHFEWEPSPPCDFVLADRLTLWRPGIM